MDQILHSSSFIAKNGVAFEALWDEFTVLHDLLLTLPLFPKAFVDLTRDIFELVRSGDIKIQDGWEGVKSGFVPNIVHSSEEVTKGARQCFC